MTRVMMGAPRARRAAGSFGAMTDQRDPHDLYETPEEAVHKLVRNVWTAGYPLSVWDPSCGRGAILKALMTQTHCPLENIVGTDKHTYNNPVDPRLRAVMIYNRPFEGHQSIIGGDTIIMNPPYSQADEHVRHAIRLIPEDGMVCALLRWNWITAIKRRDLLGHLHTAVIVGRLKMLPPDVPDKGHSGTVDFAWFCFAKDVIGHATSPDFAYTKIIRA